MKKLFFYPFLAVTLILSCSRGEEEEGVTDNNNNTTQVTENPNPAANNAEIIAQYNWTENQSTIWSTKLHNNDIYAIGLIQGNASIMKLNASGTLIWSKPTGLKNGSFTIADNKIFATGNYDTNADGENDRSKIIAYDMSGNFLAEYIFNEAGYSKTVINALASIPGTNSSRIVLGGYVQNNNLQYPYILSVSFNNNQIFQYPPTINNGGSVRLNFPQQRIINLTSNNGHIYYSTNEYSQLPDEVSKINFAKLKIIDSTSDEFETVYSLNIAAENPQHKIATYTNSDIVMNSNNEFYITGRTDDDKTPAPSGGGYWGSGLVVKINDNGNSGNTVWKKKINVSNKTDRLYGATFYNNSLYLFGSHSSLIYTNSQKDFSNGQITKIDTNGNIVATKTFGDKSKRSGFNNGLIINGQIYGFGYSGLSDNAGADYKAWIVKTNSF